MCLYATAVIITLLSNLFDVARTYHESSHHILRRRHLANEVLSMLPQLTFDSV